MLRSLQPSLQATPGLGLVQPLLALARAGVQRLLPWLVPVALVLAWQMASALGWLSTRILPAPSDVVAAAWTLALSGELATHVQVSAGRALTGLALAAAWVWRWDC